MNKTKLTNKQKAEQKAEKKAIKLAELIESNLLRELESMKKDCKFWINQDVTYKFKVGDKVVCGDHPNTIIEEVHEDGKIYKVKNFGERSVYGKKEYYEDFHYMYWTNLRPFRTIEENVKTETFSKKRDMHIQFCQQEISSLFNIVYHAGIDIDPDYQRGNVWEDEDKLRLIDSIFDNIEIGKFAIIKTRNLDKYYELLDGKQRLLTLVDFYENRMKWNGKYFNDLSWTDQMRFECYSISVGYVEGEITQKQKYQYFLNLNTGGKPVAKSHLDKVRKLLNE